MTGREKIEAAFTPDGSPEFAAVICYEDIYIRDHWSQLTSYPWWYAVKPDVESQLCWRREVIGKTAQDWFALPSWYSRDERQHIIIEERGDGVFRIDGRTGTSERLVEPRVGGWSASDGVQSHHPTNSPQTPDEIDALIPIPPRFDAEAFIASGRADLAKEMLEEFGDALFPLGSAGAILWDCYFLWGYEGMMLQIADKPELVRHACERFLQNAIRRVHEAAALGAAGVWIEDCGADQISPEAFAQLNVPPMRRLVEEVRAAGMKSIYYFCGNPRGKFDLLMEIGADALSFEESKKGFVIDIDEVVERVAGRCVVLGNLDAIHLMERGSEQELRAEIARQIAAGRRNRSRFIVSLGSPVTPGTPVERVRRYCDLVHELSRA